MKKRGVWSILALLVFVCILNLPVSAQAASYKWKSVGNGDKRCYKNGELVKNKWVGDKHLNSEGYMDRNKWVSKKVNGVKKMVFVRDDGKWVKNFKKGWQKIGKKYYYYTAKGVMKKSCWLRAKDGSKKYMYYLNAKGQRVTGLQQLEPGKYYYFTSKGRNKTGWVTIKGKTYFFDQTTRAALINGTYRSATTGKYYRFDTKGVRLTGWQKNANGTYSYFNPEMKTGWLTLKKKTYYLNTTNGERATGVYGIANKLYYFNNNGVLQKSKTVTYEGRKYIVDANGVCTLVPDTATPSSNMLFFLTFESGSLAYNQTGGDSGCACGAYQFDYRYSLLEFIKYAYSTNANLCAEFKTFAAYPLTDAYRKKLKSNKALYAAWNSIYYRNPSLFAELQDKFARVNYYDPVERQLAMLGINLASRPDVVKGAVYSYSIQHGAVEAVNAVRACGFTNQTENATFIKNLYKYRAKKWPAYKTRYTAERDLALSKL